MAYLIKSSVMDALHEDEQITIMCYEDKKSKDLIQFCYESMEREINKLSQYRLETVTDVGGRQEPSKLSNADRIRAMNNEELTKIILCPYDSAGKPIDIMPCVKDGNIQELVPPEDCKKCMLEWLQSEVEE